MQKEGLIYTDAFRLACAEHGYSANAGAAYTEESTLAKETLTQNIKELIREALEAAVISADNDDRTQLEYGDLLIAQRQVKMLKK